MSGKPGRDSQGPSGREEPDPRARTWCMEQVQTDERSAKRDRGQSSRDKDKAAESMTEITPSAYRASRQWTAEMKGSVLLNEGERGKARESFTLAARGGHRELSHGAFTLLSRFLERKRLAPPLLGLLRMLEHWLC